jgi:hypothetical protein
VDISKESDNEESQEENKKLELLPYEITVFVIVIIAGGRKKFYNRNGIITINSFLLQIQVCNSSVHKFYMAKSVKTES